MENTSIVYFSELDIICCKKNLATPMGPSQRHMLLVQCAWIHSIFPKWWIFAFEGLSDFQPFIRPSIQWVLDPVPADWVRGRLHPGQYIIVLTKRKGEPFMLTFISMASLESSNKLACMPLHPVTCRKPWDRFKLTTILLQGKYHASLLSRDALFPWSP